MIHEMLDSTCATAQVPLQALAHHTPAKAGPITDGRISVHFARAFKDSRGVAPHRYILECRVKRTQELLATELSLSEIAVEVGFADQSHLTRWFRELVGATPGSYRWSMR